MKMKDGNEGQKQEMRTKNRHGIIHEMAKKDVALITSYIYIHINIYRYTSKPILVIFYTLEKIIYNWDNINIC